MSNLSLDLHTKQSQNIRQIQRLIMSPQMQQAIHLLQMPVLDLSQAIEVELQQNPVLENEDDFPESDPESDELKQEHAEAPQNEEFAAEHELSFDEHDFEVIKRLDDEFRDYISDNGNTYTPKTKEDEKLSSFLESSIPMTTSLFEHLMQQARETFEDGEQLAMAEVIIGNLDSSGFLHMPMSEISSLYHFSVSKLNKVLKEIQGFDPNGVGGRSLQESLLIQLRTLGKENTLAYRIISQHFEDLIHNKIPVIQKSLKASPEEINQAIGHVIAKLDLHPGAGFSLNEAAPIVPDVAIVEEDNRLVVTINNEYLPSLRINRQYMKMLSREDLATDAKEFIKSKIVSAKWLLKNIFQRNETIERIAESLAKRQREFFIDPKGELVPLTMKTLAEELSLHESTIARAVANKYVSTPRGLFSLKFFFSNTYIDDHGKNVSSRTVRNLLKELLLHEDKSKPLSDEALSLQIKAGGIPCARRTVAKYRAELNIGNAQQRKKFEQKPD